MTQPNFSIQILGTQSWDPEVDNIDVEVTLADGRRFGATFFTLQNIEILFRKNVITGECRTGLYLWASNMIVVRRLTRETIEITVSDLLENGELEKAFSNLTTRGGG